MRVLWMLPKAAPALLRHLAAYVELAALDLDQSRRDAAQSIVAAIVIGLCVFFAVLLGCAAVVALTWDTPYRVAAIGWMGLGFVAIAVMAVLYRTNIMKKQAPFLASVRQEWKEDSVILERILADEDRGKES